jgi:hypothetical protein
MRSVLSLLSTALAGSLAVVGMAIGLFYRRKFGEGTRGWLLGTGAALGTIGSGLLAVPSLSVLVGDLVALAGAVFLGAGTFWLWYVMLGPRR